MTMRALSVPVNSSFLVLSCCVTLECTLLVLAADSRGFLVDTVCLTHSRDLQLIHLDEHIIRELFFYGIGARRHLIPFLQLPVEIAISGTLKKTLDQQRALARLSSSSAFVRQQFAPRVVQMIRCRD